ncbi:WG repeat-containing protein [Runella sp. MFBS21]
MVSIWKDQKYSFIDSYAQEVIVCKYDYCGDFDENGLAVFEENCKLIISK